ncbi:gamma-glutamyl cyclotransferase [Bacillus phage G]|uniref:Gp514 n=1 Tax=Bacillus phage G TaxID=2884420 RepID=G3MAQ5_9CAUD|nr:gamma-glutamyl cyclotransferase [Bacillus phage G]AEO93772.1 gp514 [Bacillus phage G]
MSNKLYFAYGSNLLLAQMRDRCKTSKPISPAVLKGYKLTFKANKRGLGVADIIEDDSSEVFGAVYEVTEEDLKNLDKYEGHPNIYHREEVTVIVSGEEKLATTYVMDSEFKCKEPEEDYLHKMLNGYHNWNLPINVVYEAVKSCKRGQ